MKKIGLIIALAVLVSCTKNILPGTNRSIEGRWAQINESHCTSWILEFKMGKCYTYQSPSSHFYDEGTVWGCPVWSFRQVSFEFYAIKDSCLVLGDPDGRNAVNVGRVYVNGDHLTIGENNFARVNKITDKQPDYLTITSLTLNKRQLTLFPDEKEQLVATIFPAVVLNTNLSWKSDNPAVADVSDFGLVRALSPGTAFVSVSASSGIYDICKVTVNEK